VQVSDTCVREKAAFLQLQEVEWVLYMSVQAQVSYTWEVVSIQLQAVDKLMAEQPEGDEHKLEGDEHKPEGDEHKLEELQGLPGTHWHTHCDSTVHAPDSRHPQTLVTNSWKPSLQGYNNVGMEEDTRL